VLTRQHWRANTGPWRRFLLHVLPRGFMRIRHYGLLANRHRAAKLARCRALLGVGAASPSVSAALHDTDREPTTAATGPTEPLPVLCPVCGKPLRVLERIAPQRRDTS
jgi:hypothetical protein